jgi:hypothetical protein
MGDLDAYWEGVGPGMLESLASLWATSLRVTSPS